MPSLNCLTEKYQVVFHQFRRLYTISSLDNVLRDTILLLKMLNLGD